MHCYCAEIFLEHLSCPIFPETPSVRCERPYDCGKYRPDLQQKLRGLRSIFGDSIFATAVLDRLHHSTTVKIHGDSYRLKHRRKARLVPRRGQEAAEAAAR